MPARECVQAQGAGWGPARQPRPPLHGGDAALVAREVLDDERVLQVPHLDAGVERGRDQELTTGRDGNGMDRARVPAQLRGVRERRHVVQVDVLVVRAAHDETRRDTERMDRAVLGRQRAQARKRCRVPWKGRAYKFVRATREGAASEEPSHGGETVQRLTSRCEAAYTMLSSALATRARTQCFRPVMACTPAKVSARHTCARALLRGGGRRGLPTHRCRPAP